MLIGEQYPPPPRPPHPDSPLFKPSKLLIKASLRQGIAEMPVNHARLGTVTNNLISLFTQ